MGVAAEVPQCSAPRSPRGVDKLSQRPSLFYTPQPPLLKKVCTPDSCKLQAAADFSSFFLSFLSLFFFVCEAFVRLHLTAIRDGT